MTHISHAKFLPVIVDVGGSGIDFIDLLSGVRDYIPLRILDTPRQERSDQIVKHICMLIDKHIRESKQDVLIGLPGPINHDELWVNCPPLNTSIRTDRLVSLGYHVVNDVVSQLPVVYQELDELKSDACLVTLGTSLGFAYARSPIRGVRDIKDCISLEIAHTRLKDVITYDDCDESLLYNQYRDSKLHRLFSAGGFAEIHGIYVYEDDAGMKRVDGIKLEDSFEIICMQREVSKSWIKLLRQVIEIVCIQTAGGSIETPLVLRGGLFRGMSTQMLSCFKDEFRYFSLT